MDIQTFFTECLIRGIRISLAGDSLNVESDVRLKPATADFIRKHKGEIIQMLAEPEHGACIHCGIDTQSLLTVPGADCMWWCPECFGNRS